MMADDRMKNREFDKHMDGAEKGGQQGKQGQQSPGRKQQDDQSAGQRGGGSRNVPDRQGQSGGNKGNQGGSNR